MTVPAPPAAGPDAEVLAEIARLRKRKAELLQQIAEATAETQHLKRSSPVTLTDLIPGLKGSGSRRAVDKVAELREENIKLLTRQAAADDYFALLQADRADVYACWEDEKRKRQEAEEVAARTQSERDEWRDEAERLRSQLAPYLAAEANANAITVPPMVRDTSAIEDQATGPTDVRPLWDALGVGPTAPVTDPGHTGTH